MTPTTLDVEAVEGRQGLGYARGRSFRRSGGGREPIIRFPGIGPREPRPRLAQVPRLPYQTPPAYLTDPQPDVPMRPLPKAAVALQEDYHRRHAFWQAIAGGLPAGRAGTLHLRVAKARTSAIRRELTEAGGPLPWFRREAAERVASGEFPPGRGTYRSERAESYYTALAGGREAFMALRDRFYGHSRLDLDECRRDLPRGQHESLDFLAYHLSMLEDCP